ncbi:hypothetical protein GCM10011411_08660 [Aurantiacibacter arachoides]|nr:hypothetical protein GCM10011411_08660 [Aurantiacibacter arachoides]
MPGVARRANNNGVMDDQGNPFGPAAIQERGRTWLPNARSFARTCAEGGDQARAPDIVDRQIRRADARSFHSQATGKCKGWEFAGYFP